MELSFKRYMRAAQPWHSEPRRAIEQQLWGARAFGLF